MNLRREDDSSPVPQQPHPCRENSSIACHFTGPHRMKAPIFHLWWPSPWSPQLFGAPQSCVEARLLRAILYVPLVVQSTPQTVWTGNPWCYHKNPTPTSKSYNQFNLMTGIPIPVFFYFSCAQDELILSDIQRRSRRQIESMYS